MIFMHLYARETLFNSIITSHKFRLSFQTPFVTSLSVIKDSFDFGYWKFRLEKKKKMNSGMKFLVVLGLLMAISCGVIYGQTNPTDVFVSTTATTSVPAPKSMAYCISSNILVQMTVSLVTFYLLVSGKFWIAISVIWNLCFKIKKMSFAWNSCVIYFYLP